MVETASIVILTRAFLKEIAIFYRAKPREGSVMKLQRFCKVFRKELNISDIIDYVDFCEKQLKKIKDRNRRRSVDYFVGIIVSENVFSRYIDDLKAKGQIDKETNLNEEDEDGDVVEHKGVRYEKIKSHGEFDIFYNKEILRFLVADFSSLPPKIYTLKQYNQSFPQNRITMETVEGVIT
jgi:hypothetical protein